MGNPSGLQKLRVGARVVWSKEAAVAVKDYLDRFQPDIVHCHNLFPALSPSVLRQVNDEVPVVMTLHNYRLMCLPGVLLRDGRICEDCVGRLPWPGVIHGCYQGAVAPSLALGLSLALNRRSGSFDPVDLHLAISHFVREKHIEAGLAPERIVVKPHFAWPSTVQDAPGEYFLYLGRLSPEKGVSTLLRAWERVDNRLLIVGEGPEEGRLRSIAPPNVEFRPPVAPDSAKALIGAARAVMVPSVGYEGAGKVVLEAYAAGVPVAVSRAGGLPEVVKDGSTGLIVAPGQVGAWGAAIDRLLDDSEVDQMRRACLRFWADEYSPERGLAQLEDVYRSVSARHAG